MLPGRAADHLAGLLAHGDDVVVLADRDHRRLADDDALALDVDEDVGRAEVDADLHRAGLTWSTPFGDVLDPRTQVEELALDVLIPPPDLVRAVDDARALGGERREDQRGAGAQVAHLDLRAVQVGRARDRRVVAVVDVDRARPSGAARPSHSRRSSKIVSWMRLVPLRLGQQHGGRRLEVRGETRDTGPSRCPWRRSPARPSPRTSMRSSVRSDADADPLEDVEERAEVRRRARR